MISEILRQAIHEIEQHEQTFPSVYGPKATLLQRTKEWMILAATELKDVEPEMLPTI